MNNNPMQIISQMLMQAKNGNPQQFAENILKNNPNFANSIQGQNPKQLALNLLRQRGIDPSTIENMMRGK
jgi:Tfp pilus assembly pilus retraction ATPase PilT